MYKNRSFEIDFDVLAEMLKDAVDKVKSQENPDTLNQIKKTYKKNVNKRKSESSNRKV